MNIDPISSSFSSVNNETRSRIPTQVLDQEDFLKLLVTQLTSQDPMNPKKDLDFIGEMATFTSLEQTRAMHADLSRMRLEQQILQANSLIGREVQVKSLDNTRISGLVTGVEIEAGMPKIVVNGTMYPLSDLASITPTLTANQ